MIQDDLVGSAQHTLHGLKEETLARHLWRLLVLLVDFPEARRLTVGLRHRLFLVGFCCLQDAFRLTSRLWLDLVGVSLRFVDCTLTILQCGNHILEGTANRRRRQCLLDLHFLDFHTRLVERKHLLDQLLGCDLDWLSAWRKYVGDLARTDHLAHGALGDRAHGGVRLLDLEQVVLRVIDDPQHDEVDVDDVLIASKHQALFGHITTGDAAAALVGSETNLNLLLALNRWQANLLTIGAGRRRCKPGSTIRLTSPKRSTMPFSNGATVNVNA